MHDDNRTAKVLHGQGPGSITAYLAWDHTETIAMLEAIVALVESRALERAEDGYGEVRRRLLLHVQIEERVVFPVWERRFGRGPGPTQVFRDEHLQITANIEAMRKALEDRDADAFGAAHLTFTSLIARHKAKEESFFYPGVDAMLTPEACAELLLRMLREQPMA